MDRIEKDEAYLKHILEAIGSIEKYTANFSKEDFIKSENKLTQDAVVREFEIIGEATGRLSDEIKKQEPNLPWKEISSMRNKLIHEYFGVDLAVVWKTVQADLPLLKVSINKIVSSMPEI